VINSFSFIEQEHRDNYNAVLNYLSQDAHRKLSGMQFNDRMMPHLMAAGFVENSDAQEHYGALLEMIVSNPPAPVPHSPPGLSEPEKNIPSSMDVDTTKKHYLPQFYLEGFSFDGKRICVFDKEASPDKAFYIANIAKVEKSWRAYSMRSDYYITEHIEPGILGALRFIRENPISAVNDYLLRSDARHSIRISYCFGSSLNFAQP